MQQLLESQMHGRHGSATSLQIKWTMSRRQKGLCLLAMIALLAVVLLVVTELPYEAVALAVWSGTGLGMLIRGVNVTRTRLIALSAAVALYLGIAYALAHHRIVIANQSGEDVHFLSIRVPFGHYFDVDQEFWGDVTRMRTGSTVAGGFFDLVNPGTVSVSGKHSDGTTFRAFGELAHRLTIFGGHTEITICPDGDVEFKQH